MEKISIVVNGAGKVGNAFIKLLSQKRSAVAERTGVMPVIKAVTSRNGILYKDSGLEPLDVELWMASGKKASFNGAQRETSYEELIEILRQQGRFAAVEATPTDLNTGEPGLSHLRTALANGGAGICLAKGPLVVGFRELRDLAKSSGVPLCYSGAVAAALPTVDTALYSLAGADVTRIEGVLNGTSNFILNKMAEGEDFRSALETAQRMGVAESDYYLDVSGFDSAAKMVIIANSVWDAGLSIRNASITGIAALEASQVRQSANHGTPVRLVARAVKQDHSVTVTVAPEEVPRDSIFVRLPGTSKAISFMAAETGQVAVVGGASDVVGAAYSCVKDLIHVLETRWRT